MLNLSQNTVLLSKLCRKTKSVLIGAQPILSITFKFHARRMRGAKSVQTIGFLLKPVGARCARPSKYPPTATPTATHKIPPYSSPLPQKRVALNSRACSLVPLTGVVSLFKKFFSVNTGSVMPPTPMSEGNKRKLASLCRVRWRACEPEGDF